MEMYNSALCISHAELTSGIMTAANLRQLQHRGQVT